ncbi:Hsp20/alpha crystallin family protein [Vampirovibrio chlorellavorus]|uniref:Hsp20/alpha crystallin family protein n=1 Tax=Vampirovibrio chlorellavorus TaxID=758823 RepID=UPI0026EE5F3C|nr:Hsp20/alpha crystallin family protein [Vampirovibrio chlorellavorus]
MRNRRTAGLYVFTGAALLLAVILLWQGASSNDARQHLDNLLGQASANGPEGEAAPATPAPSLPDPLKFPDLENSIFGMPVPTTDIMVEETSSAYVLRVPLAKPEDSSAIKVEVTPHRIEVSGQTGSQSEGQTISSSFMQTFSTAQEVVPGQVYRQTEQNGKQTELVITIPKKVGGDAKSSAAEAGMGEGEEGTSLTPEENPAPALQPPPLPANDSPLDTFSNRMI